MEITVGGTALVLISLILCGIPSVIIIWFSIHKQKLNNNTSNLDPVETSKTSTEEDTSNGTAKKTITWRRLLVFSLICLILLPCNFIFTLGSGMSGDAGEFATILIIITFLVHIAITLISGVAGVALWSISALNNDN